MVYFKGKRLGMTAFQVVSLPIHTSDAPLTLSEGQQCPIAPGTSLTYKFRADTWRTSWYHSHYSAQYTQGLIGPIVIHGLNHVLYDIDLGPVLVTDSAYLPKDARGFR